MGTEPQTVYLVETGCYSSAGIDAVFSNRSDAEVYEANCGDDDHRIIEMVLDEKILHRLPWVCILSLGTGDQITCEESNEPHYRADCKSDKDCTMVSAWGKSEEHARKTAADFRMRKLYDIDRDTANRIERDIRIAQQFEDLDTSRFIEARNAAMLAGAETKPGSVEVLDEPFVPPTQDQKAMMDPFYDMWVAGVKE